MLYGHFCTFSYFCPVSCSVDFEEDELSSDGLESVKKAFWQMNYGTIIENENQRNMQGEVVYRKRNIRRYTSNGFNSQFMTEIKRWRNVRSSDVDILKDAGEKIIEDTAEVKFIPKQSSKFAVMIVITW